MSELLFDKIKEVYPNGMPPLHAICFIDHLEKLSTNAMEVYPDLKNQFAETRRVLERRL